MSQNTLSLHRSRERYGLVFLLGFFSLLVVLLPLMVLDKGYFIYYGDFISQQLPFYEHANDVVRSGGALGWDWYTDLGSSFLGSYAFYLFGSPFFWLSTLLPENWVLYAIPWLLCLKHGLAALTAYGYIRRFVRSREAAVIGGLLYAFSGFQTFNIFFNHFQDVTAFFPLLLISLEELVNRNRRGWFAACVALMAALNYFFFAGQVVFVVIYFFVRVNCRDFSVDLKKLLAIALEAVIGVCIACAILLPAAMAVLGNERVSAGLYGQDMILYSDKTRILRIIQSFFMIPDPPARPNLIDTSNAKWASIGGYLPLFSMAGVITFLREKKKHWASVLTWICIVCALVPFLNSAFYMFNGAYYARWFYMPLLIMAMMTAHSLDDTRLRWKPGVTACGAALLVFGIISLLPVRKDGEVKWFAFAKNFPYFIVVLCVSALCWLGLVWLLGKRREGKAILRQAVALTAAACVACTATIVWYGKCIGKNGEDYRREAIHGEEHISVSYETDEADYFRVDMSEDYDNYPMFWGLSSMRCFQSVVDPSIMEFYDSIDIARDVASRANTDSYTLRGLFSVKYYFDKIKDGEQEDPGLPGFTLMDEENGFRVYRNDYFIPMGFTYDWYVPQSIFDTKATVTKERLLIRALVLDEEQIARYGDILQNMDTAGSYAMTRDDYLRECENHAQEACHDFTYDANGFAAAITLDTPKLVFFSVPYESGWTAEVNGSPVTVERVSNGFMAIRCEAGDNAIRFRYEVPGLRYGCYLTIAGLVLLALYLLLSKPLFTGGRRTYIHNYDYLPSGGVRAADAYVQSLRAQTEGKEETAHGTEHSTSERDDAAQDRPV